MKLKTLYSKGSKKAAKILGRIIPYNTHYRPASVCRLNHDNPVGLTPREITAYTIYKDAVTTLDIPDELYNACSPYWKPERSVTTNYMVVEVPNGRIHTDNESSVSVISQYNRIVENVSLSLTSGKVTEPNLNNIFEQRFFTKPVKVKGTVFSMLTGGAGINNISHWFLDVLPRLHLLRESGLYDKIDWFLVPSLKYEYQLETLELLDIPRDRIIPGDKYPHLTADCIVASTAPRGNHTLVPKWLCDYIRNSFVPKAKTASQVKLAPDAPLIYISRSDSSVRNILNENELVASLEQEGFINVVASKLTIAEKIALFSQARVVVSATGAGLINMLFCNPGTRIIEIFNENFVVEPFFDIATKAELDYDYVICKGNGVVKNMSQGQTRHFVADVDMVMQTVKKMKAVKYIYQTA
ncbi:glycosyltransferase family 61 protein [Pontibacter sp. Tf4]|uniref:glycosyltransferase family 61 protein n=1 Tax=Pontibacter sp. Tf4 TaxID=2761620 RepID=UPI00162A9563|nr:glycosyltransferase family 61 protein [Pontibacter sp. Tf4]MBB6610724.1 glycosyltransferase family 61 protein [Pontibacter sp. Tf4]